MQIRVITLAIALAACTAKPVAIEQPYLPTTSNQPYRINTGDKIKIVTFGEERLTGEFLVHGDGRITFPLFGDVPARGLTVAELVAGLTGRLAPDYVRDPQMTAEVISFQPVYILGEVARPGQRPCSCGGFGTAMDWLSGQCVGTFTLR